MAKKIKKSMVVKPSKEKEARGDAAGIFVPAGLFIGMGLGFVYNHLVAGLFIGLGAGFVGLAIAKLICEACSSSCCSK